MPIFSLLLLHLSIGVNIGSFTFNLKVYNLIFVEIVIRIEIVLKQK